jgi:hypothetical protein
METTTITADVSDPFSSETATNIAITAAMFILQAVETLYEFLGLGVSIVSITIFSYFTYSRNSLFPVVLVGSILLVLSCSSDDIDSGYGIPLRKWTLVASPIYLVTVASLALLLRSGAETKNAKYSVELSCSIAISNALIGFIIFARAIPSTNLVFFINYVVCIIQIASFLVLYAMVQYYNIVDTSKLKHSQYALLTTIFLFMASFSAYSSGYIDRNLSAAVNNVITYYSHYAMAAYGFYLLWAFCLCHCFSNLYKCKMLETPKG